MDFSKILKNLSLEAKLYCGAFLVAFLSLFMKWVDIGIAGVNGFQQQGWIVLIPLLYITITSILSVYNNKVANVVISAIATAFTIYFLTTKMETFFGSTINFAGVGLYLMIIACVGFLGISIFEIIRGKKNLN